jgi:hypothetical protein
MLQHIMMMMSIANGTLSDLFICLATLSGFNHVGGVTPILLLQFLANGHLKKRCMSFSSLNSKQSSQSLESKTYFFLLRKFLVFNLFLRSNQKKTLCLS